MFIHPLWRLVLPPCRFGLRSLPEGFPRCGIELRSHQCPKPRILVIDELRVRPGLGDMTIYNSVSGDFLTWGGGRKPSNTTMRSARAIVESRWATSKHVVCFLRRILSIASLTWGNVREDDRK